jgi:hypothetical protein
MNLCCQNPHDHLCQFTDPTFFITAAHDDFNQQQVLDRNRAKLVASCVNFSFFSSLNFIANIVVVSEYLPA